MPAGAAAGVGELFEEERDRLFAIAYRMLGSVAEAEDVVQEAFARYAREDRSDIEVPQAYLTTSVTRLAIDHLRSARSARETYVGPWLPEPLVADGPTPAEHAEMAESISIAFLVLLERLNPVERAVFLLRDVFDYGFGEIGEIVQRSPGNCRQIAVRARRRIEAQTPRFEPSAAKRDELARRFFAACDEGDADGLLDVLAADVVLHGDGGGKAPAIRRPLVGAGRVASTLIAFARVAEDAGARVEPALVNGQPGARYVAPDGRLLSVVALGVGTDGLSSIHFIVNPDKLGHIGELADAAAVLRGLRRRTGAD